MYIVRDIFHLKFGHYREVKSLLDEAEESGMFSGNKHATRVLTDFTGDSYRLVLEASFTSLAEYEQSLTGEMTKPEWQQWYMKFKEYVNTSHREILKQVM